MTPRSAYDVCRRLGLYVKLAAISLGVLMAGCNYFTFDIEAMDSKALLQAYEDSRSLNKRQMIVDELEARKDAQTLSRCLEHIAIFRSVSGKWANKGLDDARIILDAMVRLQNPEVSSSLQYALRRIDLKAFKLDVLDTCQKIGGAKMAAPAVLLLKDPDADIRWQALDTLGFLRIPATRSAIYPLLTDIDPNVRMIAANTLGKIGDEKDGARISILLLDPDPSVRKAAEASLASLQIPESRIEEWRHKAKALTLDSFYSSQSQRPAVSSPNSSKNQKSRDRAGIDYRGKHIDVGDFYALVIGNNEYKHLPELKTAVNDARAIAALLRAHYGFKVTMILNGTRRSVLSALDRYRGSLTVNDNLIIYYAGHGYYDQGANRGYWLPVESGYDTSADWISNADITDKLKAIQAKHVMVIADSCYSGTLTRGVKITMRSNDYIQRMAGKRARTVLTSGGNEPVLDSTGGNHSVFAKAILDVLSENTDIIDGTQLFSRIRRPVMVNAPQTPQYSDIRFAGHEGGDFLFIRRK